MNFYRVTTIEDGFHVTRELEASCMAAIPDPDNLVSIEELDPDSNEVDAVMYQLSTQVKS